MKFSILIFFLTPVVVLKQLGVECKLQLIFEFNGNKLSLKLLPKAFVSFVPAQKCCQQGLVELA